MNRCSFVFAIVVSGLLAACQPSLPGDVNPDRLDEAVGKAVGDPGTCVLLVRNSDAGVVYRYGARLNCLRRVPDCKGGVRKAEELLGAASKGEALVQSCASAADGSRRVGWATGPAGDPRHGLSYVAMMESQRTLPGREMATRLEAAFRKGGL